MIAEEDAKHPHTIANGLSIFVVFGIKVTNELTPVLERGRGQQNGKAEFDNRSTRNLLIKLVVVPRDCRHQHERVQVTNQPTTTSPRVNLIPKERLYHIVELDRNADSKWAK
ncbi:hypothetical protein ACMFMG_000828 [Clarireedia jacksonii]